MLPLLLISLASCYVVYVVTRSDFPAVEWMRVKVFERWDEGSAPAYLATCPWCVGFYVSGIITFLANLFMEFPAPGLYWIASAGVIGLYADVHDLMVATVMHKKNGD